VTKLYVKDGVREVDKERRREEAGRRRGGDPGYRIRKQEPHAKSWGKTDGLGPLWTLRCSKNARRCGAKHMSKPKC